MPEVTGAILVLVLAVLLVVTVVWLFTQPWKR